MDVVGECEFRGLLARVETRLGELLEDVVDRGQAGLVGDEVLRLDPGAQLGVADKLLGADTQ